VIDLGSGNGAELSMQIQGRLVTLAQTHDAAVVCLTEKANDTASIGSLVSLRAEALRARGGPATGEFAVTVRVIKDKRRGPGWTQTFKRRGPAGLV
jgi:recombination protein RecA